jgi:hypothetical protein
VEALSCRFGLVSELMDCEEILADSAGVSVITFERISELLMEILALLHGIIVGSVKVGKEIFSLGNLILGQIESYCQHL